MKKGLVTLILTLIILPSLYVCYSKEPVKLVDPTGEVLFDKILKSTQLIYITFKDKPHHLIKIDGNDKAQEKIIDLLSKANNIGF